MEENKPRYRINTSISTKGVITWDCTAETETLEKTLEDSDRLVAEMQKRYPVVVETK